MNTLTDESYRIKMRRLGQPMPLPRVEIERRQRVALDAIAYGLGQKPRRLRTPAEQRAWTALLQRRARAERRGQDASQFPPRVRLAITRRTKCHA